MGILKKVSSQKKSDQTVGKQSEDSITKSDSKAVGDGSVQSNETEKREVRPEDGFAYRIICGPVLTEKGEHLKMKGKYAFFVDGDTNKVEVARAIRVIYKVNPVSVQMLNVKGKAVRRGRQQGRRKDRKKAIVTLKAGDSISLAESA
ncbi:50S ribosomal protein L23 [Candidatus Uhrbacteria bacterium CG_4_10_14_0_8_um_filter_58_22]|uniref:Large ribosomal subunit protein uL23 n=1 Tax=Candidatus Uhrbacteria bacterium CG_4_10_14_0_8_um_filter_58_22 TaxID=1975029 RepID=A0A2M7Q9K4_9BACT|nr:MAG: 50S ribosomal protein L23 [Candidatus Uhrbacteria bacterium CG_4_10_14_0_8_um_filter_58_22]